MSEDGEEGQEVEVRVGGIVVEEGIRGGVWRWKRVYEEGEGMEEDERRRDEIIGGEDKRSDRRWMTGLEEG